MGVCYVHVLSRFVLSFAAAEQQVAMSTASKPAKSFKPASNLHATTVVLFRDSVILRRFSDVLSYLLLIRGVF